MNTISDDENSRSVFDDGQQQTVSETTVKFEYVPSLDGLRAVAVILVFFFHAAPIFQVAHRLQSLRQSLRQSLPNCNAQRHI